MKVAIIITATFAGLAVFLVNWLSKAPDPLIDLTKESLTLEVYANGRLVKESTVPKDAPVIVKIQALLRRKQGKWESSRVSFAPVVLFRGETFTINFQSKRVVVNYQDSNGHPNQVLSDLDSKFFDEIEGLIKDLPNRRRR